MRRRLLALFLAIIMLTSAIPLEGIVQQVSAAEITGLSIYNEPHSIILRKNFDPWEDIRRDFLVALIDDEGNHVEEYSLSNWPDDMKFYIDGNEWKNADDNTMLTSGEHTVSVEYLNFSDEQILTVTTMNEYMNELDEVKEGTQSIKVIMDESGYFFTEVAFTPQKTGYYHLSYGDDITGREWHIYSEYGWYKSSYEESDFNFGAGRTYMLDIDGYAQPGSEVEMNITFVEESNGPEFTILHDFEDVLAVKGSTITFTMNTGGEGVVEDYEWFYKNYNETEFTKIEPWIGYEYTFELTREMDGRQIYCIASDAVGSIKSNVATIHVDIGEDDMASGMPTFKITNEPERTILCKAGGSTDITVEAIGDGLVYDWRYYEYGTEYEYCVEGDHDNTFTFSPGEESQYYIVYCLIADAYGRVLVSQNIRVKTGTHLETTMPDQIIMGYDYTSSSTMYKLIGDMKIYHGTELVMTRRAAEESKKDVIIHVDGVQYELGKDTELLTPGTHMITVNHCGVEGSKELKVLSISEYMEECPSIYEGTQSMTFEPKMTTGDEPERYFDEAVVFTPERTGLYQFTFDGFQMGSFTGTVYSNNEVYYTFTLTDDSSVLQQLEAGTSYLVRFNGRYSDEESGYETNVTLTCLTAVELPDFKITSTPERTLLCKAGGTIDITVEASSDGLVYDWYYYEYDAEDMVYHADGVTESTYTFEAGETCQYYIVYCIITDAYGRTLQSYNIGVKTGTHLEMTMPEQMVIGYDYTSSSTMYKFIGDMKIYHGTDFVMTRKAAEESKKDVIVYIDDIQYEAGKDTQLLTPGNPYYYSGLLWHKRFQRIGNNICFRICQTISGYERRYAGSSLHICSESRARAMVY